MSEPVLEAHHLRKLFPIAGGGLFSRHDLFVHAIDDVSFALGKLRCWPWWARAAAANPRWR
ncbi:MAG: hypothetical protein R2911_28870 [Caldilineaceae bacterium]